MHGHLTLFRRSLEASIQRSSEFERGPGIWLAERAPPMDETGT
jgi:hypothetical protein